MILSKSCLPAVLTLFLFSISCKKEDITGATGPQGPPGKAGDSTLSGPVYGKVALYDTLGNSIPDNSGVSVLFENSSPLINLSTAADGSFSAPNVPAGNYNITASRTGFGSMKLFQFRHSGGINTSQTGMIVMGQQMSSWMDIENLAVDTGTAYGSHYMEFTITLAHPQVYPKSQVLIYFSHTPGAGNSSNDYVYRGYFFQRDNSTLTLHYDYSLSFYTDKFDRLDDVYISAAIDNPKLFSYTDSVGNTVYPAAGHLSNEVKVYNNLKN